MQESSWMVNFLIPISLIVLGFIYQKRSNGKISPYFGYRTTRAMLSQETWSYSNKRTGQIWVKWGIKLTIFTIIYLFLLPGHRRPDFILIAINVIVSLIPFIVVEKELKERFDKEGNPIK